ncbi:MAG TPA: hypothetical protein VFC23_14225 [Thermoanaerobaculia bacterium]|nr:hypothetical protein [Thermoanaerobaculia bacterium]
MEHQPITLNVLGYREEDEWVALALEMDLRGYGETFDKALDDLADLVAMQIGFSRFKGQPELIWKAADPVWFERFAETRREYLEALVRESELSEPEYSVAGLPIPSALAIKGSRFVPSEA